MALVSLRKASSTWLFKGLLILLALTFAAFFGVTGNPLQRVTALIEVGDEAVDATTLLRDFDRSRSEMSQLFGRVLTVEESRNLGLLDETINVIATRTLFDVAARDLGLVVTDLQVAETIRGNPQFQSVTGRFDRLTFEGYLGSFGYSEGYYTEILRRDLVRAQFLDSLLGGTAAPDVLVDTLHRYRAERRVAEIIDVRADAMGNVGIPNEATIESYHKDHEPRFRAPEYRSFVVAYLTPALLADEISISEEEIQEEFELRRARYETAEQRTVRQAVFTSDRQADAQALIDAVRGGADFTAAVEAIEGVFADDLGTVARTDLLISELADAVFAATEGEIAGPVQSPFGWHVALVSQVVAGETKTIDDVRDTLSRELALRRANDAIFEVMEELDDALGGGERVEEAAASTGLRLARVPAISRTGEVPDGNSLPDLAALSEILATAFASAEGTESQVIETGDGGFFVLRVDGRIEPALHPLEEVREDVVADWQNDERRRLAEAQATVLADRAKAGEDLSTIADKFALIALTTEPFTRSSAGAQGAVDGATAAALFDQPLDGVVVQPTASGYQVAKLVDVRAATSGQEGVRANLSLDLAGAISSDLQAQLAEVLRQDYGITIDRVAIDHLFDAP